MRPCPHCAGSLTHYGSGYSEFDWQCDACGTAARVDAGILHTRRWDKVAAQGVHEEFPLVLEETR